MGRPERKMKKTVLFAGVAAVALLPAVASAEPGARWRGFYGGLLTGWADGTGDVDYTKYSSKSPLPDGKCDNDKDCFGSDIGLDGFFGGATIGYNYQTMNNLVVGLEADIIGADINGSSTTWVYGSKTGDMFEQSAKFDIDLAGTIRGRVGFTPASLPQTLFFATGGVAWATGTTTYTSDKYKGCDTDCSFDKTTRSAKLDGGMVGYAAGVGVEHALNSLWSVKAEYLYTGYLASTGTGKDFQLDSEVGLHNFRVGLNRRFGDAHDAEPAYAGGGESGGRWDGLFIGVLAGWTDGSSDLAFNKFTKGAVSCDKDKDCFGNDLGVDGFFGGAAIGYNHQTANNLVIGIEADITGTDIGGSFTSDFIYSKPSKAYVNTASVELDVAGTVRGRLGFVPMSMPQTLLFVSGGVAWATGSATYQQDKYSKCYDYACGVSDKNDKPQQYVKDDGAFVGVTVGAGIEQALNNNWSIKAEYLYTDYVSNSFDGDKFQFENDLSTHSVRVGLNYAFN